MTQNEHWASPHRTVVTISMEGCIKTDRYSILGPLCFVFHWWFCEKTERMLWGVWKLKLQKYSICANRWQKPGTQSLRKTRIKFIWDKTRRPCWGTTLKCHTKMHQRAISWTMVFSEKDLGVTLHQHKPAMPCRQDKHWIKMNIQEYRLWGSW